MRTVQAFNARDQEEQKFHQRVNTVLTLARKEAFATGIFFGSTGWSGNVTLLALLGYGLFDAPLTQGTVDIIFAGGSLVSHGEISVGELTSLLLYTVYVGSGLQMLT
jgi:putative ABC transport system ATP-binding protein